MVDIIDKHNMCCGNDSTPCGCDADNKRMPFKMAPAENESVCCGRLSGPPSGPHERPGYNVCGFVEAFVQTAAGTVPAVKTRLNVRDHAGTISTRIGINRYDYKVVPGLYCVGVPDNDSPVFVSANYKLSFDELRGSLSSFSAWILVLDTRGINVWCAAGKGTFGTQEVVRQVRRTELEKVVRHRELILPQLGATGVAAHQVKNACGFTVIWGPVRAEDIPVFMRADKKADRAMRHVTFTLMERLVLIPVEVLLTFKPMLWTLLIIVLISGIGTHLFSISAAWHRGLMGLAAVMAGIFSGAVAAPALLPLIPGVSFSIKGALTGLIVYTVLLFGFWGTATGYELCAMLLYVVSTASFLAMNFTGATPFTSPSGVEKEMRKAMPVQAAALLAAAILWVAAGFTTNVGL